MSRRKPDDEPTLFDLPLVPEPPEERPAPAEPSTPAGEGPSLWDDEAKEAAAGDDPDADASPQKDLFDGEPGPADEARPAGSTRPEPAAPAPDAPAEPGSAAAREASPEASPVVHRPSRPATESRPGAEPRPGPVPVPDPEPALRDVAGADDDASLGARAQAGLADLLVHLSVAVCLAIGSRLLGVRAGLDDAPAIGLFLLAFSFLYTVLPLAFWGATPGMVWAGVVARSADGETLTLAQAVRRWLAGLATCLLAGLPLLLVLAGGRSLTDRLSGSRTRPALAARLD